MTDDDHSLGATPPPQLPSDHHAWSVRSFVRLIQCSLCSLPYRTPVTLPCGNSLCKQCLPPAYQRPNISYPDTPGRQAGIRCPFPECAREHSLTECSVDVVLLKVMEAIAAEVIRHKTVVNTRLLTLEEMPVAEEKGTDTQLLDTSEKVSDGLAAGNRRRRTFSGGMLAAVYAFADSGDLPFTSDVRCTAVGDDPDQKTAAPELSSDDAMVKSFKNTMHYQVECHLCYNLLLEPITMTCGHTFCRKCLARILDHSTLCPHCRRRISLPPVVLMSTQNGFSQPANMALSGIISSLYPTELESRSEAAEADERSTTEDLDTSLFVCTVAFPNMPIVLHVFEPRYRLMIRRALEGNRQFGMVSYNFHNTPQGQLGRTQFCEIGTMLYIEQCQILQDGRSWLVCKGLYRFKVLAHGTLDGYVVARTQRHDDISLIEEERIEALETVRHLPRELENDVAAQLDRMPTSELMAQCQAFLTRAQSQSAEWLQGNIQRIYGEPPTDPAIFPYWFASVVPLQDDKKYQLLPLITVRERLKLTVLWIRIVESATWWGSSNPCVAL